MKRLHVITFRNIFHIARNKNDLHRAVFLTDFPRKLQTAHLSHFDIQKQKVEILILFILKKKGFRRRITLYFQGSPGTLCPLFQKGLQINDICLFIVTYCQSVHEKGLLLTFFILSWSFVSYKNSSRRFVFAPFIICHLHAAI